MAARQTKTPGATEPVEEVQAPVEVQAEQPQETVEQVQEVQAPTSAELLAQIEQLKAQVASQPVQAVSTTTTTVKRTRAVVGPNGWTQEEY